MNALVQLQSAIDSGRALLNTCEIHSELRAIADQPLQRPRFTYARIANGKVLAISVSALTDPIDGIPCFSVGYAVLESMRQQGLATDTVKKRN